MTILDLTTTDGRDVPRGEPIDALQGGTLEELYWSIPIPYACDPFGSCGGPLEQPPDELRLPIEAVASERIESAIGGYYAPEEDWIEASAAINRSFAEFELGQSIWIGGLGLLFAILIWRLLVHGLAGPFARQHALAVAAAVAVPGLILPVVQVGTPAGVGAGFLVPGTAAVILGGALARHHPEPAWVQTAIAGALVAAALVAAVVVRYLSSQFLGDDAGTILLLIGAIGVAPAVVAASASGRGVRERASLLSLGLVPVAAAMLVVHDPATGGPIWPSILVALLLGWYVLPFERALSFFGAGLSRVRSITPADSRTVTIHEPLVSAAFRDALTVVLFALVVLFGLTSQNSELYVVTGVMFAAAAGLAIRNGFLGTHWADAAIPLGVSVGLPIAVAGYTSWSYGGQMGWVSTAFALTGLSVADVLAARHSDPVWRRRLLFWSMGVAGVSLLLWSFWGSGGNEPWAFVLACLVPLVPGLPVAFAADTNEPRAVSTRLEALVVGMTLGISAFVLTPLAWVPLVAWLIAIVVWRRFTLAPLMGLMQRSQLQRDLAVAAAETERARLAADLHDDALQQLTMLVRTLDEGGHKAEADEAREVATKLRSVVGDLRLPILDDLGAGRGAGVAGRAGRAAGRWPREARALRRDAAARERRAGRLPRRPGGADERDQARTSADRRAL